MSQAPSSSAPAGSQSGLAFIYWVIVAIPLTWGVANSINSSLPLFGGKATYIPWVIGAPPAKPAATPAAIAPAAATPAETPAPAANVPTPLPTASAAPEATVPIAPTAAPFSTPEPSATAAPIVTPNPPTT